jgi:hypothetical protein
MDIGEGTDALRKVKANVDNTRVRNIGGSLFKIVLLDEALV